MRLVKDILLTAFVVTTTLSAPAPLVRRPSPSRIRQVTVSRNEKLDITSIKVANRDHAIVSTVTFVRAVRGDLGIRYWARGEKRRDMALVFNKHRPRGDNTSLLTIDGEESCRALTVTWDHEADVVKVRLPSRCFREGDYGAVRVKVITEIGSDADFAPKDADGDWRWTDWISRG